jgi:large subunit ribosomal protein L6
MSRIGRLPIDIPAGVNVTIDGSDVTVKGPKGELALTIASPIEVKLEDGQLLVSRPDDERNSRSLHGLTRTLIANQIIGVTDGYTKGLDIVGTGYRVAAEGQSITFALGYSHPITVAPPAGITFTVEGNNRVIVSGRAFATRVKLSAARPESQVSNHGSRNKRQEQVGRKGPQARTPSQEGHWYRGASAPGRHPFGPPRIRAGCG